MTRHWHWAVLTLYLAVFAMAPRVYAQSSINLENSQVTITEGRCSATWIWPFPYGTRWVVRYHCDPPPPAPVARGGLMDALVHYFGPMASKMHRIAGCESEYDTTAYAGPFRYDGRMVSYIGLFQVDPYLHGAVPGDVWGQVAQAKAIYDQYGLSAWPVCRWA